jgi:hypothetical protein
MSEGPLREKQWLKLLPLKAELHGPPLVGDVFFVVDFDGLHGSAEGIAAVHDGAAKTVGEGFGKLIGVGAAVDIDGLSRGVDDDFAVMTGAEVFFHLGQEFGLDLSIEEVG